MRACVDHSDKSDNINRQTELGLLNSCSPVEISQWHMVRDFAYALVVF